MSKYLYIFDPGHGGLINGKYQTAGKRSPKFEDGKVLFEGVNNRDNVRRIMDKFRAHGLDCINIVGSEEDVPLPVRVKDANKLHPMRHCIYISIHSDAAGDGKDWHPASGITIYTSKGKTKSDPIATSLVFRFKKEFGHEVRFREDNTDGDPDKEADFYVLKNTKMPAVLCELGFHTNKEECMRMQTLEFKNKIVNAFLQWALELEE